MNSDKLRKKILIAPLDWGLGHAARCISIIRCLQKYNCSVTIAATGKVKNLLQQEFPTLCFIELRGYSISYSRIKRLLPFKILIQIPKILKIIRFENKWLDDVLSKNSFDAVISDNRYGLFSKCCPSVFITHQLNIKTNFAWLDQFVQRINYSYINRFSECWVPDFEGGLNIAGSLSHPAKLPAIPLKYIGPLARFTGNHTGKILFNWFVIISGPEPQRSLFEKKIFATAAKTKDSFLIVRGLPGETELSSSLPNCKVYNHLSTDHMEAFIASAQFIISRCGYTTVMEMLSLKKRAVFIPTPGQTEQEYLAAHLLQQNWSYAFNQEDDFLEQLQKAKTFNYSLPDMDTQAYEPVIGGFIRSL